MSRFLIFSIVGSIILTALLNLLPLLFPHQTANLNRKIQHHAERSIQRHEDENQPNVRIFFPWKAMIIISVVLTVAVNLISFLSQR